MLEYWRYEPLGLEPGDLARIDCPSSAYHNKVVEVFSLDYDGKVTFYNPNIPKKDHKGRPGHKVSVFDIKPEFKV